MHIQLVWSIVPFTLQSIVHALTAKNVFHANTSVLPADFQLLLPPLPLNPPPPSTLSIHCASILTCTGNPHTAVDIRHAILLSSQKLAASPASNPPPLPPQP